MCIAGLFQSIVKIVTILTSVGDDVYWAIRQLPTQLFITVIFGWIAFYLFSSNKKTDMEKQPIPGEKEEIPTEKLKTSYKVLIYFCEAIIVLVSTFIISSVVMLISNRESMMMLTVLICFIAIPYFLPSPQEVFNYLKKKKCEGNTH